MEVHVLKSYDMRFALFIIKVYFTSKSMPSWSFICMIDSRSLPTPIKRTLKKNKEEDKLILTQITNKTKTQSFDVYLALANSLV